MTFRKARCRHYNFWPAVTKWNEGTVEQLWCPDCGAQRQLLPSRWSGWVYPDGQEKALRRYEIVRAKR
jgi:hypothetical protein